MANNTDTNEYLVKVGETEINMDLCGDNTTQVNQELLPAVNIDTGTTLGGKYEIIRKLDVTGGEADLYLCRFSGEEYVAKIYRRDVALKDDVINVLKNINSRFVAKLYDVGTINGKRFEITSYYKNGSIQGRTFTLDELKKNIIPSINEGLKTLHNRGIIHKDLKPSNA